MTEQIELFSRDYSETLLTTDCRRAAEQYLRDTGLDWLPMRITQGSIRWGGRLDEDGFFEMERDIEFLESIKWPEIKL